MSGEVYSYLFEKILEEGALDIFVENIVMKKNRPANKITIICYEEDKDKFSELLLKETSTFGVRYNKLKRFILRRKFVKVETKYGLISAKLGYYNEKLIKASCEYDECKLIAKREGVPLIKVYNELNLIICNKIETKLLT